MTTFIIKTLANDRIVLETFDNGRMPLKTLDQSRIEIITTVQADLVAPTLVTSPAVAPSIPYPGIIATVSTGLWGGTQPIVYTYQWVRDDGISQTAIPGATGNAYVVQNADIGSDLYVEVTATNGAGSVTVDSNTTNTVINAQAPVNIVAPVISGTLAVGNTLSLVSDGTWTGNPAPTFSYQWLINGSYLAGEIGPTLLIEAGMETGNIDLLVFGSNIIATVPALSNEINNFIPPSVVTPPSISGSTTEGNVLTATDGTWNGALPITYTYQWYRYNGVSNIGIPGATNNTYTTTNADVGFQIRVQVTATNAYGFASSTSSPVGPITSAATAPVNTIAPVISGLIRVGGVLSCTDGTWTGTGPITYAYQWKADGVNISGATSSTYSPIRANVGKTFTCVVTATNTAGSSTEPSNSLISPLATILNDPRLVELRVARGAGLYYGLDAASDGDPVGSWNGYLNTAATQSTTSRKPTRTADGVSFDGTDDYLDLTSTTATELSSIGWTMMAGLYTNTISTNRIVWSATDNGVGGLDLVNLNASGDFVKAVNGGGTVIANAGNPVVPCAVWVAVEDTGTNQVRYRESGNNTSHTMGTYPSGITNAALGCRILPTPVLYHQGTISCMAVFSEALSFVDMQTYETLLNSLGII